MAISLDASARHDLGRGASRRLRREQRIPAIIIGGGQPTVAVSVSEQKLILAALKDEFFKESCIVHNSKDVMMENFLFNNSLQCRESFILLQNFLNENFKSIHLTISSISFLLTKSSAVRLASSMS